MVIMPIGRTIEILFVWVFLRPKSMGRERKLIFFWPKMYRFPTPQKGYEWPTTV